MKTKVLITTAIDYANDVIHIGHAYEKILADCCTRYFKKIYGPKNVFFSTGTDEHGVKNQSAAKEKNLDPKTHADEISKRDQEQIKALDIDFDRFIRTTDEDHIKVATEFFKKSYDAGDIYKSTYEGIYCSGCEAYKTITELDENGNCPYHRPDQIQKIQEENFFFRWSKYSDFLKDLISNNTFVLPEGKKKEMLAFIENGIQDIPVSRPKFKLEWGITTPIDETQVIYVWFDALINYYTFALQHSLWNEDTKIIHFVGKDIARWHCLLWPAMLKSAGLRVPDSIYVHGFINLEGQKISKSLGNVIRPSDLVNKYGADAVRYYFLRYGPIVEDVDVSILHLEQIYNADLANGLGNTVSRLAKLAEKSGFEFDLQEYKNIYEDKCFEPFSEYRADLVLGNIWKKLADLDKHINENEPWKITDGKKLKEILSFEINEIRRISLMLEPFIPETSKKIQSRFGEKEVKSSAGLFPRLN